MSDSLRPGSTGGFGDGDGTAEGSSGGLDGQLVGDAAFAGSRVLDRPQSVLVEADFDAFVEATCKHYYAAEGAGCRMSAFGYKRTYSGKLANVRFTPESGHW